MGTNDVLHEPVTPERPGPQPPDPFWHRVATLGFGVLVLWYFLNDIWPMYQAGIPVPLPAQAVMALLLLILCGMIWKARSLPPATGRMHRIRYESVTTTGEVCRLLSGPLRPFIVAGVTLNGGIALVLLLARSRIIDFNVAHANGFILFMVYTCGNLLLFAAALVYLERGGYVLSGNEMAAFCGKPDGPPLLVKKDSVLTVLSLGFTALYFLGPLLAFGTGIIGPETHDRDILISVVRPDPSTFVITFLGGRDAGTLVGLEASESAETGRYSFRSGAEQKVIAGGYLGSEKGTIPLETNRTITWSKPCPNRCTVEVTGYFSDERHQIFYNAPA
jgi:hypothetical protein